MGVHIIVTNPTTRGDHPDWDCFRFGGDREAAKLIVQLPLEEINTAAWPDVEPYYRPADFAAWRAAQWPDVNADRWQQLIDILERDPEYWIYLSY